MARDTVWEIVFLMVILKIPIVYLCTVVWYAIKSEPRRGEGAPVPVGSEPEEPGPGWGQRSPRRLRPRPPHGGPARRLPRGPRTAYAAARGTERR